MLIGNFYVVNFFCLTITNIIFLIGLINSLICIVLILFISVNIFYLNRLKGGYIKTMGKGKIIAKKVVERKSGYLYYVDGEGNVCEAPMARKGRKKKSKG